ncbi:hypothetical protein KR032_000977, partial [Drosophila birchii]
LAEFTNIVCTSMNKNHADFDYCLLKAVNRTYKYVSLKLSIYEKPITNIKVNFAVYKRANGYKPFLYNVTLDGCKFLKKPKSNNVIQYFYGFIKDVSNLNHSCPLNEDIIIEKLSLDIVNHRMTVILPVPAGDYLFQAYWTFNNKWTVLFKLSVQLKN